MSQLPGLPEPFSAELFHADQMRTYAEFAIASVKREPLTKEKLRECWEATGGTRNGYGPFARAIEQAHGIGASVDKTPVHNFMNGRAKQVDKPADNSDLVDSALVTSAQQWLPIESAPKDETTPFLVLVPVAGADNVAIQVSNFQGEMYPDHHGGIVDFDDRVLTAVGWMPLPASLGVADKRSGTWVTQVGGTADRADHDGPKSHVSNDGKVLTARTTTQTQATKKQEGQRAGRKQ